MITAETNEHLTVFLKGPCHEIFDLWFFFIKQSHLGPRFVG
jgi:hypothetical protein